MGTTLVVAVFQAGRVMLGHIGDSRCYRLRGRDFQQITKDHSLLQEQIDAGLITPEQALRSVNKNLITRAFGVQACRLLDVTERRVKVGDIYLMCSDGLSDMVRDACIADFLLGDATLAQKAKQLIVAANAGGGRDNISVALTHVKRTTPKRGFCPACAGNSKNVWRIKKAVVSYAQK
jgi:protein phosphatase